MKRIIALSLMVAATGSSCAMKNQTKNHNLNPYRIRKEPTVNILSKKITKKSRNVFQNCYHWWVNRNYKKGLMAAYGATGSENLTKLIKEKDFDALMGTLHLMYIQHGEDAYKVMMLVQSRLIDEKSAPIKTSRPKTIIEQIKYENQMKSTQQRIDNEVKNDLLVLKEYLNKINTQYWFNNEKHSHSKVNYQLPKEWNNQYFRQLSQEFNQAIEMVLSF